MRQVSPIRQLGIVLSAQLVLMTLVGLSVFATNQALGDSNEQLAIAGEPHCESELEPAAGVAGEQSAKLPSARGGSFKFLAF